MKSLKRFLIKHLYPLARLYWFLLRPYTRGVKCLLLKDNKILLVKLNYGLHYWAVPGGGVHTGEAVEHAALREIKEELGIEVQNLKKIGEYTQEIEYKHDTVTVYTTTLDSETVTVDGAEVLAAEWFPLPALPSDRGPQVDTVIALYRQSNPASSML